MCKKILLSPQGFVSSSFVSKICQNSCNDKKTYCCFFASLTWLFTKWQCCNIQCARKDLNFFPSILLEPKWQTPKKTQALARMIKNEPEQRSVRNKRANIFVLQCEPCLIDYSAVYSLKWWCITWDKKKNRRIVRRYKCFFFRLNKFWIEKSSLNCQIHARPTVAISKYASENDCALFSPINVKQADVFNAELFQTKIQIVINGKNIDSKTNMRRKRK